MEEYPMKDLKNNSSDEPDAQIKTPKESGLKEIFENFAQKTTIPAVSVLNQKINIVWKFIWFVVVVIGLSVSIYQSVELIKNYLKYPSFITTVEKLNRSVYFPAVTLCPENIVNWEKVIDYNHSLLHSIQHEVTQLNVSEHSIEGREHLTTALMNHLHLMDSEERKEVLNDVDDWLYVFSGQDAEGRGFISTVDESLQQKWYSPKFGSCITVNPGLTEETKLKMTPQNGFVVMAEIKEETEFPYLGDLNSLHLSLHPPGAAPVLPMLKTVDIFPGEIIQVSVYVEDIQRLPSPYASKCADDKQIESQFTHSASPYQTKETPYSYSREECLATCTLYFVLEEKNCYLSEFAINETYQSIGFKLCSDDELDDTDMLISIDQTCAEVCPKRCREYLYDWSTKTSRITNRQTPFIQGIKEMLDPYTYSYISNVSSAVIIFINLDSSIYLYSEETAKYELEDIFGSIGGNLGLWIGLSILSAFEVFELLTNIVAYFICKLVKCRRS